MKWPKVLLEEEGFVLVALGAWTRQRGWKEWVASGGLSTPPLSGGQWRRPSQTTGSSDGLGLASGVDLSKENPALFSLGLFPYPPLLSAAES